MVVSVDLTVDRRIRGVVLQVLGDSHSSTAQRAIESSVAERSERARSTEGGSSCAPPVQAPASAAVNATEWRGLSGSSVLQLASMRNQLDGSELV